MPKFALFAQRWHHLFSPAFYSGAPLNAKPI